MQFMITIYRHRTILIRLPVEVEDEDFYGFGGSGRNSPRTLADAVGCLSGGKVCLVGPVGSGRMYSEETGGSVLRSFSPVAGMWVWL